MKHEVKRCDVPIWPPQFSDPFRIVIGEWDVQIIDLLALGKGVVPRQQLTIYTLNEIK